RGCRGLAVELPGLGEVRVPLVEVLRLEQPASLADRGGEDRRVDPQEASLVEEVVDRLLDFVPHREDRALTIAPEPEMPVVQQKIDAVLLRLDRIVERAWAEDFKIADGDFITARGAA